MKEIEKEKEKERKKNYLLEPIPRLFGHER